MPDFTIPANFFSTSADSVFLAGTIQPPLTFTSGQLPLDGIHSLTFDGATLSTAINSPTNFNGDSGSVTVPEPDTFALLSFAALPLLTRRRIRQD